jgi:putative endonuclease
MHTTIFTSQADPAAQSTLPKSEPLQTVWWLYLLACKDGRTYIGITLDVAARFQTHTAGKGAKFTRSNPPLSVLGAQPFSDKSAALQAEYALKQLDKTAKLHWATQWPYGR